MSTEQNEALRLADEVATQVFFSREATAAELRRLAEVEKERDRLHEANRAMLEALTLMNIDCQHVHHDPKDRHTLSEACPVVFRINAAISKGEKA
jgi:hypothetical protein